MFDPTTDFDIMMREGLRAIPVPQASEDFDAKVLQAVANPVPWWRALMGQARPLLSGAACSLAVTLFLVHWATAVPMQRSTSQSLPTGVTVALDSVLDKGDVRAGSLTRFSKLVSVSVTAPAKAEPQTPKPGQRAAPVRRSEASASPTV